jgi:chemotaxis protein histidine kinase CheA
MTVDPFAERLARVRQRFVSVLASKIEDTYAALPILSGTAPVAVEAVGDTYRRMHGLVGIGATVGFARTGRAARSVEEILLPSHHARRGLTKEEIALLKNALHGLREAAAHELQSFYTNLACRESDFLGKSGTGPRAFSDVTPPASRPPRETS